MTVAELNAKKAKIWNDAKAFLDSHRDENGIVSEEDGKEYDAMINTIDNLEKEVSRMNEMEARDMAMNQNTTTPIVNAVKMDKATGRSSEEYNKAFNTYIRTKRASDALQEDTNSEGGYLVPVEFERVLYKARDKVDPIFALAGKITLGSLTKNVPYVASEGAAALIAEEGSYGDTDDSFGQVTFHAYKFGRICKASEELIADSAFSIEGHLAESFGRAIGKAEASYFWKGTGSSQPQGVLTGASVGITTATTNKITADEIIDLYYSVPEQYRDNAVWVFNDATIKEIRKLKDGNGNYLWVPGLQGQPDTIMGKPVHTSVNIDTIAAGKVVGCFGDLSLYKIADRSGFEFRVLNELYAANGQVGFRGTGRTDGRLIIAEGIKTLKMHA